MWVSNLIDMAWVEAIENYNKNKHKCKTQNKLTSNKRKIAKTGKWQRGWRLRRDNRRSDNGKG